MTRRHPWDSKRHLCARLEIDLGWCLLLSPAARQGKALAYSSFVRAELALICYSSVRTGDAFFVKDPNLVLQELLLKDGMLHAKGIC